MTLTTESKDIEFAFGSGCYHHILILNHKNILLFFFFAYQSSPRFYPCKTSIKTIVFNGYFHAIALVSALAVKLNRYRWIGGYFFQMNGVDAIVFTAGIGPDSSATLGAAIQTGCIAIIFATAATLHANGIRDIETSAQAAEALRPIAGNFAFALFALGIIGTGLLAVPVLAGSAAYAVTEMFGIAGSLDAKPTKARLFYGTISVTTMLGVSLQYVGIDPARALYWAAVVNGVLAAPLMVMMMLIVRNPRAMGRLTLTRRATIMGWSATAVMAIASLVFFAFTFGLV